MMHWRVVSGILLLSYIFFDYIKCDEGTPICTGEYKNCCFGYLWNSTTNVCENCAPGYTGMNCIFKCPYPTYGIKCQNICYCREEQCDVSTGCNSVITGTTTAQEFNPLNMSVTLFTTKINISLNIAPNLLGKNDRIFIFLSTFGCIGIVLLIAHLIVYIIHRRQQAVSMTIVCENHQDRGLIYDNINDVSCPTIQ